MPNFNAEHLLDAFQSNVYPTMLDDLAGQLGVSSDSLRRLGVGWCPIVTFKKGASFVGWWAIPERDSDAKPTGLALRNQNGDKTAYPGSKHGCVYEVNPDHERGDRGYSPGAHNWRRTMDAGIVCPICGKPDGCLVSSDNPTDPKAAVCIRERSPHPLRFGYLHIRKPEGQLAGQSALANRGGPVVVVEGMSDTATAMDLGFDAVGRPSNLAGNTVVADLVRGRPIIIIGENDKKPDGREPGKEGMIACFQTLKRVCKSVTMVMPPSHIKDLRAWKVKFGLTREALLAYVEANGQKKADHVVIEDDRPTTIARAFLDSEFKQAGRYIIRQWEDTWYKWQDGKYVPLKQAQLQQAIYQWSYDKQIQTVTPKGEVVLQPVKATPSFCLALMEAMMAETLITNQHVPCWVNGKSGPDPRGLVVFSNGILDVNAFLSGEEAHLRDHTPDLFITAALPIPFDPTAECPEWLKFLGSSLGDEPAKATLLQEWIGYCMTPDTSLQKMMFFRGPPSSGKGRCLEVIEALVGKEQTAWLRLNDLSGPFGVAPLMGKLVGLIGDARTPKHWDAMAGLEILLNITGNDGVSINRKFKDQLAGQQLMSRITIASNSFLEVPDHAGAMIRRLNVIDFPKSFESNPDTGLPERLLAELPGIAIWALTGLRRLRQQGKFTVPESSRLALEEWRLDASPVAGFIEECCDKTEGEEVLKEQLYECWTKWSAERPAIWQLSKGRFLERMRANAPYASSETYEKGGHKFSVFRGLTLKRWARKQYLGDPT